MTYPSSNLQLLHALFLKDQFIDTAFCNYDPIAAISNMLPGNRLQEQRIMQCISSTSDASVNVDDGHYSSLYL